MRYNKFLILLLSLLLLTGCRQAPQPPQSETDPDDLPAAEQPAPKTSGKEDVEIEEAKQDSGESGTVAEAVFELSLILLDKIATRQIIESPYLALIHDTQLKQNLLNYNDMTAGFYLAYTQNISSVIIEQNDFVTDYGDPLSDGALNIMHFSDDLKAIIETASQLCLYEDAEERITNNPAFAAMDISWTDDLQTEVLLQDLGHSSEELQQYFALIDSLTLRLSETIISFGMSMIEKDILEYLLQHEPIADSIISKIENHDLTEVLFTYNEETALFQAATRQHGLEIVSALLQISEADFTDEFHLMAEEIARLALYRNAQKLVYRSPVLAKYIAGELGGSAGQWPRFLHSDEMLAYFDRLEQLTTSICQ